jgi:hypothetical protein
MIGLIELEKPDLGDDLGELRKKLKPVYVGVSSPGSTAGGVYSLNPKRSDIFTKEMLEELKAINDSFSEGETLLGHVVRVGKEQGIDFSEEYGGFGNMHTLVPGLTEEIDKFLCEEDPFSSFKRGRFLNASIESFRKEIAEIHAGGAFDQNTSNYLSYMLHRMGQPILPKTKLGFGHLVI